MQIDEFHNLINPFEISSPNDTMQFILILLPRLMTLYTERSSAHLTVATHYTVSFSACSNSKLADLEKRGGTEIYLIAAETFLSVVTGLSTRNVDHGVCVTK